MSGMWLVIAGMTLVTLVPRVTPLLLLPGKKMPEIVGRWLSLIAPAILAALLSPDLLLDRDSGPAALNLSFSNTYLLAAVPAFLVAWRTRSLFGTVVTGMAAAALLRLLG